MKKNVQFLQFLFLLTIGIGISQNLWASGRAYVNARSTTPAQGLVYISKSNTTPTLSQYQQYSPGGSAQGSGNEENYHQGEQNGSTIFYSWAKPARGFYIETGDAWKSMGDDARHFTMNHVFPSTTTSPTGQQSKVYEYYTEDPPTGWDGVADHLRGASGGNQSVYHTAAANFKTLTPYIVQYSEVEGGSYTVTYNYYKTRQKSGSTEYEIYAVEETATLEDCTGKVTPVIWKPEADDGKSFATEKVILNTTADNWIGWYEDGVRIDTDVKTNFEYTINKATTITAGFKSLAWGEPIGDLNENNTDPNLTYNYSVSIPVELTGSWQLSDFDVQIVPEAGSNGTITKGTVTLSDGILTIPYTYNANGIYDGTRADVIITPSFGVAKQFEIVVQTEEVVAYDARIEVGGEQIATGTLADMLAQANAMDNQPTIKLMNDLTCTSTLSFLKSMTFDINGKTLTGNTNTLFSIDAADIDVVIEDGSFTQTGVINNSTAYNGIVSLVGFTQKAKLSLIGGQISVENTADIASNANAKAYGLNISHGSVFYMTNGLLTAMSDQNAVGVYVASVNDFATINGGTITVVADSKAYAIRSSGKTNADNMTWDVTTTGAEAFGIDVEDGISTLSNITMNATAATSTAYGAYVGGGRLNMNGGRINSTVGTSAAYGVHIQPTAMAVIQQNTIITAEAIGSTGTNVIGVNNVGTATISNATISVTTPTNNAMAINTASGATSTTIEAGTYIATATTGTAYGIRHQAGTLNIDGGTFKALGEGNNLYAIYATENADVDHATLISLLENAGSTVYGFYGSGTGKNMSISNSTFNATSATTKAYGIYSEANITTSNCEITAKTIGGAEACGIYAKNGNNSFTNTSATVTANTKMAYGIQYENGTLTVNGGVYNVEAKQTTATTTESSELYGIKVAANKTANVSNATFKVTASNNSWSQNVYGAYVLGTLTANGNTFDVTGSTNVYGVFGTSTLTLSNNTITAFAAGTKNSYGVYSSKNFSINGDIVTATSTKTAAYSLNLTAAAIGTVHGGKFKATGTSDYGPITKTANSSNVHLQGGYYNMTNYTAPYIADDYTMFTIDNDDPEYANGYRYKLSDSNPMNYVCKIGSTKYATLEDALQYTIDNPTVNCIIVMQQSYTLPAGNYLLPENASLLVPYEMSQNSIHTQAEIVRLPGILMENICLTFASGAYLDVKGKIEVGAQQTAPNNTSTTSYVNGAYGRIHMSANSAVSLQDGARVYAWGYITGSGEIIARNGSKVYEMFQLMDMRDCSTFRNSKGTYDNKKLFPISQYYVQNIECPTTYYYGSQLSAIYQMYYASAGDMLSEVKMVGLSGALFLITDNNEETWVRKTYNPTNDRQVWEINSSAALNAISITLLQMVTLNSGNYVLPLTNNMDVRVLSGNMNVLNNAMCLPGSTLTVEKTANLTMAKDKSLYFVDSKDGNIASIPILFSPSWNKGTCPRNTTLAAMGSASVNVRGEFKGQGRIMTTSTGANIYSTNADAGTITFENASPIEDGTIHLLSNSSDGSSKEVTVTSPKLKNTDGSYTTTSAAVDGHSFIFMNDEWQDSYTNGCFRIIGTHVYAKPSEYVELKETQEGAGGLEGKPNADHTYTTIEDKLLICQENCDWWEVVATSYPNVFECQKPGFEGYYQYNSTAGKWEIVTVNVTFYVNEIGTSASDKQVVTNFNGVPDQSVVATSPTKAKTDEYTYTFYGWKSSKTNIEYHWSETLEPATEDMSYRPVFTAVKRKYTITLVDANNGESVPVETAYGELPSYTPTKAATPQYTYTFLGWSPTFAAVTGPATYTANWDQTINLYTITWMNEGTVLKTDKNQMYGLATSAPATAPSKDTDDEFVYTFDGWTSSLTGTTAMETPAVAGNTTYSAHYATTPRYLITFVNYDGEVLQQEPVTQGVVPAYADVPRRDPDRDGYFKFDGWKNSNGDKFDVDEALPAVTQKETYTSQWEYVSTVFTVTFVNYDGEGTSTDGLRFGEGEIPSCPETVAKVPTAEKEYTLDYWVASNSAHYTDPLPAVSKDETYTAHFAESARQYTITWMDGNGDVLKAEQVAYGNTPAYSGATPTKASTAEKEYTFNNTWSPAIVAVSGDATYTAQFKESAVRFVITWINGDGSILKTDTVAVGVTPVYSGETPSKATTATQIFTFNNTWAPAVTAVSGDATYRAQFDITVRTYEIIFNDYNGTELKRAQYEYGVTPTCPQPSREGYVFTGWNPAISAVTGAQTYKAQYVELVAIVKHNNVSTPYGSLSAAVNAVQSGDTVVMQKNYSQDSTVITFNKNMTLDLNGKTLSSTAKYVFEVSSNTLNIIDSSNPSAGKISYDGSENSTDFYTMKISGGTLNLYGGTIYAKNSSTEGNARVGALRVSGGTFNMYGGHLKGYCGLHAYGMYEENPNGKTSTVNMYGGDIFVESTNSSTKREYGVYISAGTLNIMGGEIKTSHTKSNSFSTTQAGTINISGGKFKGHNGTNTFNNSISNITGGYFVKTGNVSAKSGYQAIGLTDKHPEYANDYRYVVEVPHSITWDANGGTISTPASDYINGVVASQTSLTGAATPADPTRAGYTFAGWSSTLPETMPAEDVTITAQWNFISEITSAVEYTGNVEAENLTITTTGSVNVTSGSTLSLTNLYIQANASASGELFGAGTIEVDNAYMDYTFDGKAFNRAKQNWYAFAVPFVVDPQTLTTGENKPIVLDKDMDIVFYDGEVRATYGPSKNAWKYVDDEGNGDGLLHPGVFYLAAFAKDCEKVRFPKKDGSSIVSSNTISTAAHASQTGKSTDANWNGIANPALYYSTLSSDTVTVGQIYVWSDKDESNYKVVSLDEALSVGKPIFIQTVETTAIATKADRPSAAPKRMLANTDTKSKLVDVRITAEGNNTYSDRLFVATDEEAKDEYTIGADLMKAGVASKRAQMWVSNYNEKLCLNTVAPMDDVAEYALGISVPNTGAYVIEQASENEGTLYLTQDGMAIWNLTDAACVLTLEAGTNSNYGLRFVKNIPGVVTTLSEAAAHAKQAQTQKLIKDNHLLIINNGKVYDAQGAQLR